MHLQMRGSTALGKYEGHCLTAFTLRAASAWLFACGGLRPATLRFLPVDQRALSSKTLKRHAPK